MTNLKDLSIADLMALKQTIMDLGLFFGKDYMNVINRELKDRYENIDFRTEKDKKDEEDLRNSPPNSRIVK